MPSTRRRAFLRGKWLQPGSSGDITVGCTEQQTPRMAWGRRGENTGREWWRINAVALVHLRTRNAFKGPSVSVSQSTIDQLLAGRCSIIRSPRWKVSPGRQFIGKNLPHPAAARTERIFTGKLSVGGNFSSGRFYNGETFYGASDILIMGNISIPWLSVPGQIFHGETFWWGTSIARRTRD